MPKKTRNPRPKKTLKEFKDWTPICIKTKDVIVFGKYWYTYDNTYTFQKPGIKYVRVKGSWYERDSWREDKSEAVREFDTSLTHDFKVFTSKAAAYKSVVSELSKSGLDISGIKAMENSVSTSHST